MSIQSFHSLSPYRHAAQAPRNRAPQEQPGSTIRTRDVVESVAISAGLGLLAGTAVTTLGPVWGSVAGIGAGSTGAALYARTQASAEKRTEDTIHGGLSGALLSAATISAAVVGSSLAGVHPMIGGVLAGAGIGLALAL